MTAHGACFDTTQNIILLAIFCQLIQSEVEEFRPKIIQLAKYVLR